MSATKPPRQLDDNLLRVLEEENRLRAGLTGRPSRRESLEHRWRGEFAQADRRLAVYGTLAPGKRNHGVLAPYGGTWTPGTVTGSLHEEGWGAAFGAPAFVYSPTGPTTPIELLESDRLASAWPFLDDFEGDEYLRILVPVTVATAVRIANLYALRSETTERWAALKAESAE